MNVILILITVPVISLAIAGVVVLRGVREFTPRWDPKAQSVCAECWYDLAGIESNRCPECGGDLAGLGTLTREKAHHLRRIFVSRARGTVTACLFGGGLLCATIIAFGAYRGFVVSSALAIVIGALCPILIIMDLARLKRIRSEG